MLPPYPAIAFYTFPSGKDISIERLIEMHFPEIRSSLNCLNESEQFIGKVRKLETSNRIKTIPFYYGTAFISRLRGEAQSNRGKLNPI